VTSFLNEAGAKKVLFVPWALKDWDKYFANPATIEYDATGQPKDHTGRPQARYSCGCAAARRRTLRGQAHHTRMSAHRASAWHLRAVLRRWLGVDRAG
jgi:hypothetical protein